MSDDSNIVHKKVNHIMAGEIRFKVDFPEKSDNTCNHDLEVKYSWVPKEFGENSPHTGQIEK